MPKTPGGGNPSFEDHPQQNIELGPQEKAQLIKKAFEDSFGGDNPIIPMQVSTLDLVKLYDTFAHEIETGVFSTASVDDDLKFELQDPTLADRLSRENLEAIEQVIVQSQANSVASVEDSGESEQKNKPRWGQWNSATETQSAEQGAVSQEIEPGSVDFVIPDATNHHMILQEVVSQRIGDDAVSERTIRKKINYSIGRYLKNAFPNNNPEDFNKVQTDAYVSQVFQELISGENSLLVTILDPEISKPGRLYYQARSVARKVNQPQWQQSAVNQEIVPGSVLFERPTVTNHELLKTHIINHRINQGESLSGDQLYEKIIQEVQNYLSQVFANNNFADFNRRQIDSYIREIFNELVSSGRIIQDSADTNDIYYKKNPDYGQAVQQPVAPEKYSGNYAVILNIFAEAGLSKQRLEFLQQGDKLESVLSELVGYGDTINPNLIRVLLFSSRLLTDDDFTQVIDFIDDNQLLQSFKVAIQQYKTLHPAQAHVPGTGGAPLTPPPITQTTAATANTPPTPVPPTGPTPQTGAPPTPVPTPNTTTGAGPQMPNVPPNLNPIDNPFPLPPVFTGRPSTYEEYLRAMSGFEGDDYESFRRKVQFERCREGVAQFQSQRYPVQFVGDLLRDAYSSFNPDSGDEKDYILNLPDTIYLGKNHVENVLDQGAELMGHLRQLMVIRNTTRELDSFDFSELESLKMILETWQTNGIPGDEDERKDIVRRLHALFPTLMFDELLDSSLTPTSDVLAGKFTAVNKLYEVVVSLREIDPNDVIPPAELLNKLYEQEHLMGSLTFEVIQGRVDIQQLFADPSVFDNLNIVLQSFWVCDNQDRTQQMEESYNRIMRQTGILLTPTEPVAGVGGTESLAQIAERYFKGEVFGHLNDGPEKSLVQTFCFAMEKLAPLFDSSEYDDLVAGYGDRYIALLDEALDLNRYRADEAGHTAAVRRQIIDLYNELQHKLETELETEYNQEVRQKQESDFNAKQGSYNELKQRLATANIPDARKNDIEAAQQELEHLFSDMEQAVGTVLFEDVFNAFAEKLNDLIASLDLFAIDRLEEQLYQVFPTNGDAVFEALKNAALAEAQQSDELNGDVYDPNKPEHQKIYNKILLEKLKEKVLEEARLILNNGLTVMQRILVAEDAGFKQQKHKDIIKGYLDKHLHELKDRGTLHAIFEIDFDLGLEGDLDFNRIKPYLDLFLAPMQGDGRRFEKFISEEIATYLKYEQRCERLESHMARFNDLLQTADRSVREGVVMKLRTTLRKYDSTIGAGYDLTGISLDNFTYELPPTETKRRVEFARIQSVENAFTRAEQSLRRKAHEQRDEEQVEQLVQSIEEGHKKLEQLEAAGHAAGSDEYEETWDELQDDIMLLEALDSTKYYELQIKALSIKLTDLHEAGFDSRQQAYQDERTKAADLLDELQDKDERRFLELSVLFLQTEIEDARLIYGIGAPEVQAKERELQDIQARLIGLPAVTKSVEKTHREQVKQAETYTGQIKGLQKKIDQYIEAYIDGKQLQRPDGSYIDLKAEIGRLEGELQYRVQDAHDYLQERLAYERAGGLPGLVGAEFQHFDDEAFELVETLRNRFIKFKVLADSYNPDLSGEMSTTKRELTPRDRRQKKLLEELGLVEGSWSKYLDLRTVWTEGRLTRLMDDEKKLAEGLITTRLETLFGRGNVANATKALLEAGSQGLGEQRVKVPGGEMKANTLMKWLLGGTPALPVVGATLGSIVPFIGTTGGLVLGGMASGWFMGRAVSNQMKGMPHKILEGSRKLDQLKKEYKVDHLLDQLRYGENVSSIVANHPVFQYLNQVEAASIFFGERLADNKEYTHLRRYVYEEIAKIENQAGLNRENMLVGEPLTEQAKSIVDKVRARREVADREFLAGADRVGKGDRRKTWAAIGIGMAAGTLNTMGASATTLLQAAAVAGGSLLIGNAQRTPTLFGMIKNLFKKI